MSAIPAIPFSVRDWFVELSSRGPVEIVTGFWNREGCEGKVSKSNVLYLLSEAAFIIKLFDSGCHKLCIALKAHKQS